MMPLLPAILKITFLILLWLFILFVTNAVRSDLFGRRVSTDELQRHQGRSSTRAEQDPANGVAIPVRLRITSGRGAGRWAVLPGMDGELTLGRAGNCSLEVDDDYASGHHAKVWRDAEGFVIEDTHSTNGTYVNGHQITQATRIGLDDVVRIGRSELHMEA